MASPPKFVLLKGIREGNRFFTTNSQEPTRLNDGTVAYTIIGYADTVAQAQIKLYGKSYTDEEDVAWNVSEEDRDVS